MDIQTGTAIAAIAGMLAGAACAGEDGQQGPQGPPGIDGEDGIDGVDGIDGEDGEDGVACWDLNTNFLCDHAEEDTNEDGLCDVLDCQPPPPPPTAGYVGGEACALCHFEIGERFAKSGHPHAMTAVGSAAPTLPFDDQTGGIPDPPAGPGWSDIAYVIGGFGWKLLLVGADGFLVTGDEAQHNFANAHLGIGAEWVAYRAGETRPFDCGTCHSTGWIPCPVGDDSCERQDERPGMAGAFAEPGVQCEACHGPGGEHVGAPYLVEMRIDRDPEACGRCHHRGPVQTIHASEGFIEQYGQWNEMFQSKKHVMRCIDCHDPHASAKFAHPALNPNKGIRVACASCHVGYDGNQKSGVMQAGLGCTACHMPLLGKSAVADATQRAGDLHSHLFLVNSDVAAGQFASASESMPYVSMEFACRHCHYDDPAPPSGRGFNKSDAELEATATGYHAN